MTDPKTIGDLIERSGHEFHFKVVEHLRNKKNKSGEPIWRVLISPYYLDFATNKSREVDIIAEKDFRIIDNQQKKTILIRFFIECKRIEKDTVLWFDNVNEHGIEERIYGDTGLKLPDSIFHHYFDTIRDKKKYKGAKLFYSGKTERENEPIYKGLNQCLNSLVYYKRNFPSDYSAFSFRRERDIPVFKLINYPIIMLDGFDKLYRADDRSNIKENFQLEVNYAYERRASGSLPTTLNVGVSELFIIDVIKFDDFDKFLEKIDKEIKNLFKEKFD